MFSRVSWIIILSFLTFNTAFALNFSIIEGETVVLQDSGICTKIAGYRIEPGVHLKALGEDCKIPATGGELPAIEIPKVGISASKDAVPYAATATGGNNAVVSGDATASFDIPLSYTAKPPYEVKPQSTAISYGGKAVVNATLSANQQKIVLKPLAVAFEDPSPIPVELSFDYTVTDLASNIEKVGQAAFNYQPVAASVSTVAECSNEQNGSSKLCWGVDTGQTAAQRNFRDIMLSGTNVRINNDVPGNGLYFDLRYPTEIAFRIRFTRDEWVNKFNNGIYFLIDKGVAKYFKLSKTPFNVDYSSFSLCKKYFSSNATRLDITIDPMVGGCVIDPDEDYWLTIKPVHTGSGTDTSTSLLIGWL